MAEIDELFLQAFGLKVDKAVVVETGDGKPNDPNLDYGNIEVVDEDEAVELSFLGTPVIFPITFASGKYKKYNNDGEVELERKEAFRLPSSCIVDFSRDKIIGKTKINNSNGTVKETFGFDDWRITIRGFCVWDDGQKQDFKTAQQQEEELLAWDELVDSIDVVCKLFSIRKIDSIVIEKIPINALRGKPKIRPFVIQAVSDTSLHLIY